MRSPGAAATTAAAGARSLSSGSYPSGQSSGSASQHIEARGGDEQGREDGGAGRYPTRVSARGDGRSSPTPASVTPIASGGVSHHHQQQQQRSGGSGGRGARAATMSSLLDTTALTSSTSTPSGEIGGRAMAHLLDSVASSTASSPATGRQTPPEAAGRRSGAGGGGGAYNEKQTYQPQHRHLQQQQQQQKSDVKGGWDATAPVTRHSRRAQPDVDARTLDSTPAQWSRTPPQAQRKPTRTAAAAGASASSSPPPPPLASSLRRAQRSGHHHQPASGAQRYGGSDTDTPTPPRVARFDSPDDGTPSPYSRGAGRGEGEEEEEEDASTFYSQDGENDDGDDGDDADSRRRSSRYGHGGNWASPSEVLQLRSMFQEVTARYQREQARLEAELHKAQEECRAYASERASVQSLQKAYAEGLDLCARAKRQQAQWEEERALQQLQLEKVLVENQRLQLFIAKKQKLHAASQGHTRRGGRTPTESQERVRAVVDGMTAGAVRGAAEEGAGAASLSPVTPLYGPSVTPSATAAAAALDPAARPTTAPPLAPHAAPQRLAVGGYDPFSFPAGSYSALASTANFLHTHEEGGRGSGGDSDAVQGSPYAVLSAESTPGPRQPFAATGAAAAVAGTAQQQQHSQLQKTTTVDSGSVVVADHTQLPVQSLKGTATRTEVTAVSPSTEASASNLSASPSPLLHDSAQSPRSDQHQQHHQHRSSSLVTPSPSHSGAATATTASSPTGEDAALDETATGGGHSRPLRTARYEHRSAAAAGLDLRDGRGSNIDEANQQEQNTDAETGDGATSAEFDPSYARGVNDISTSGTSRGSNLSATATAAAAAAASALVVGKLMDAQAQLQQLRRHDLTSDAMLTSDTLGDIRLTNTTQSGDSRRDTLTTNTNRHSSGPLDTAAAAAAANSRRAAAAAAAAAATTTTTTTTPSLGSTAGTNVSTSTWSLQYLYQLPRSPAEALQEEVRMLKELQRLTEENGVLEARLQHVLAVKDMDCDQREQQQLRLAQEHEQARRSAAHWELTAHQLESEAATLRARCAEQRDTMDAVLEAARRQQQQAQSRLVELEASCRAALTAAREETCVRLAALRKAWADAVNAKQQHQQRQQQQQRSWSDGEEEAAAETRNGSSPAGATTRNRLQSTIDALTAELHTLKAAHTELQDRQHALESEARLHQQHAGGALHRTQDALDRAVEERNSAALRIEVLEAEVERLREAAATREACMRATEERLRLATAELTAQAEQLVDAAAWQARAVSAEEETETQRSFYEREINVYRTAACAMQERHHAEMESAVRRYEKLVTRFEALKLRLSGVLTGCVAVGLSGDKAARRRGGNTGEKSASNAADNSPNVTKVRGRQGDRDTGEGGDDHDERRGGGEVRILSGEGESPATAQLACDSVAALRASVATTDQIVKSLNRGASAAF